MRGGNVIELAAHRGRALSEDAATRRAERQSERSKEAAELLDKLRRMPRIPKDDRPTLARNLGRLLFQMEPEGPKVIAKVILGNLWQKRKRYVRLPSDPADTSIRYAASGLDFAGIIQRLVDQKAHRGFDRTQAMTATVHEALKGTSFRQPTPFQMPGDADDGEAAYLVRAMGKVFDKLAQDADLAEHFKAVSKYPVYPKDIYSWSPELKAHLGPHDLFDWEENADSDGYELESWVPWWAPKCVIGHLYVRFPCVCYDVPEQVIAEIKTECGGEITREKWMEGGCSSLVESSVSPELTYPHSPYHRLPIWLIALPSRAGLVPCLYASADCHDYFQIDQSLKDESYYALINATTPCFVDHIGKRLDTDAVYFSDSENYDDPWRSFIHVSGAAIKVIGHAVDKTELKSDFHRPDSIDDLPDWLHPHPVQRILKLTMDSDEGRRFALLPRMFFESYNFDSDETVFRPAFLGSVAKHTTPLGQNTIAAYLVQNFVDASEASIFEALKKDALGKAASVRVVIDREIMKFQDIFDARYGK